MNARVVFACLVTLFALGSEAHAQQKYILPQVGNGTYAGGSIRTSFIFFNPTNDPVEFSFKLTDDLGRPMLVTIPSIGTTSSFGPYTLQKGGMMVLQTDGTGALGAGAAVVTANRVMGVSSVFSLYDAQQAFQTEAGVGASEPATALVLPVDSEAGAATGVAVFNPGTASATVNYRLIGANGQDQGSGSLVLPASGHTASFATGPGGLFADKTSFQGTLELSSAQPIAALTLRQNPSPLSYTTLPVMSKAATGTTFNLPQVANGTDSATGLTMRTTFVVFNFSATAANVTFSVRKPDGAAFPLTLSGVSGPTNGNFSHSVPPGGAAFLQTDGAGPLSVGSAQITSTAPVGVSSIFTLLNGGLFLTEAGVGDAPLRTDLSLPVDNTGNYGTGVAFFNPGETAATVSLRLLDENGARIAEAVPFEIPPRGQTAKFVTELFAGLTGQRGSLAVRSSSPIAAVTLRQNFPPITYTTLPVVNGTSSGTLPPGTLMASAIKPNVTLTSNQTIDVMLDPGFKLTGTIGGKVASANAIWVKDSTGRRFSGDIDHNTGKFQIVTPPGMYNLFLCGVPRRTTTTGLPSMIFPDAAPVPVSQDTTRNMTVGDVALRTVSGTVTGVDQLPPYAEAKISFTTADGAVAGVVPLGPANDYTVYLPDGQYTASLVTTGAAGSNQTTAVIYNLSPIPVAGKAVNAGFTVPVFSTVRGTALMSDLSPAPANSVVEAIDPAALNTPAENCDRPDFASKAAVTAAGAYELRLANGKSYRLRMSLPFAGGVLQYTPQRTVTALAADRIEDFLLPAVPATVTVTGRVTNAFGDGLSGAKVIATSKQLSGATDLSFTSEATTDSSGNYTLTVLSGAGYTVTFNPANTIAAQ